MSTRAVSVAVSVINRKAYFVNRQST